MSDSIRNHVRVALERNASACLDTRRELDRVLDAVVQAIRRTPEAVMIRAAFAHAPTGGARIIVTRALGGKREGDLLNAAARLAGCEVFRDEATERDTAGPLTLDSPEADTWAEMDDGEG